MAEKSKSTKKGFYGTVKKSGIGAAVSQLKNKIFGSSKQQQVETKDEPVPETLEDQAVRDAFDKFDVNGDGVIDETDLATAMSSLGGNSEAVKQIENIIAKIDVEGKGFIRFVEFKELMATRMKSREKYMLATFKKIDANLDGFITPEELENALKMTHPDTTPEEIEMILREIDTDGDGKISFQEYNDFFTLKEN